MRRTGIHRRRERTPPERGWGWNDGPPPRHAPPGWVGPPPPGGWDGPPPPGGWNRPWDGPPRDVDYGRRDFSPFNYNTFTVFPVFNWQYGGSKATERGDLVAVSRAEPRRRRTSNPRLV